jgi:adenylate cyclase class IV
MKKDQEVELRVLVKNMDKDQTRDRILALGAVSHGIRSIHDTYYCDNSCKVVEDAEMNRVGSFSIRLRKEIRDGVTTITYTKRS